MNAWRIQEKEMKTMESPTPPPETIIEDSIQAGVLEALGCTVLPESDRAGHVQYRIVGSVDECFKKLYENYPVGSMDVLRAVKAARQAIFTFRKGNGRYDGRTR